MLCIYVLLCNVCFIVLLCFDDCVLPFGVVNGCRLLTINGRAQLRDKN